MYDLTIVRVSVLDLDNSVLFRRDTEPEDWRPLSAFRRSGTG
jgi:hypothetical protein